jgi:hypothetical protein
MSPYRPMAVLHILTGDALRGSSGLGALAHRKSTFRATSVFRYRPAMRIKTTPYDD